MTTPGTAIGTAAYISPEQVRGHAPTPASDIYSLGLVLLEALSGKRAFAQQTPVEAISARLSAPPDVPGDWGYGWRSLLTAMTAIDPADRPTALEVSVRGRVLDSEGADPETHPRRRRRCPIRHGTMAATPAPPHPGAADADPTDRTKVLAAAPTDATLVLGAPDAHPAAASPRSSEGTAAKSASRRRRRGAIVGAIVLAAAAVIVAIVVWGGTASSPTPPPDLPQVEEPLGTHLQELMDEVSP